MYDHHPTVLSSHDYARLQGLMCTMIGSRTPLAALLRRKLGSAVVMLPSDAGPDLVSSGRRVRFSVDGKRPEEATLVWEPQDRGVSTLSLTGPRGLALLGLSIGQSISYQTDRGRTEFLEIDYVFPGIGEPAVLAEASPARRVRARSAGRPEVDAVETRSAGDRGRSARHPVRETDRMLT